jgi:dienelactone hydrolase
VSSSNSEIFGVHEWIKDICRRLAKAGYVALAPDLFVRPATLEAYRHEGVMGIVRPSPRRRCCAIRRVAEIPQGPAFTT